MMIQSDTLPGSRIIKIIIIKKTVLIDPYFIKIRNASTSHLRPPQLPFLAEVARQDGFFMSIFLSPFFHVHRQRDFANVQPRIWMGWINMCRMWSRTLSRSASIEGTMLWLVSVCCWKKTKCSSYSQSESWMHCLRPRKVPSVQLVYWNYVRSLVAVCCWKKTKRSSFIVGLVRTRSTKLRWAQRHHWLGGVFFSTVTVTRTWHQHQLALLG